MLSLAGFYGLVAPEQSSIWATKTVWKLFETTSLCALADLGNEWGKLHDQGLIKRFVCPLDSARLTAAINLSKGIKLCVWLLIYPYI